MLQKLQTWATSSLRRKLTLLMLVVIIPAFSLYVVYSEWNYAQAFEEAQLAKAKAMARSGAEAVSSALEAALETGQLTREQIFDTQYQAIPNTNPQKYNTSYDSFTDAQLLSLNDQYLQDKDVLYAVAADINGYVPTHNSSYSQPLTGDYETDLTNNRTKRIFTDTVAQVASLNTQPYLQQYYLRDNGQRGWDISSPITVNGKHWGAYRVGLSLDRLDAAKLDSLLRNLLGVTVVASLVVTVLFLVVRRSTRPLDALSVAAVKASAGDLTQTIAVTSHDEIGTLASTFNGMIAQLNNLVMTLEDRVQARTAQLRASAEVSRTVTSILNPEELLKQVADLITNRFGFYYTGVFVLDADQQQAVLHAATGEAGRVLLERAHHLPLDENSMVGTAILTGRPRIALDVGQGAVRFANPLLPNTRSEIALPLRIGARSLGALDVQSEEAGAFDESSTEVLQAMADQIAVAIFNAETFQRSERQASAMALLNELSRKLATVTSLEDISRIVAPIINSLVGESRLAMVQRTSNPQILALRVFTANPDLPVGDSELIPLADTLVGECVTRGELNYTADFGVLVKQYSDIARFYEFGLRSGVILPLRVGEHVLGTFNVGSPQHDAYSAQQISQLEQIASQLAVTVENLNLAEQTQQTLAELDAANRQLIGQAWEQYTHTTKLEAAEWRHGVWSINEQLAPQHQNSRALIPVTAPLTLPIKVRGTTIGEFHITAADAQSAWDDEDMTFAQSLIDQVGQVLETARLLDETERTAQREKAVADAADKIHRSTDIESVLQSAVTELQRITGRRGISVQLGFGRATSPGNRTPNGEPGGNR